MDRKLHAEGKVQAKELQQKIILASHTFGIRSLSSHSSIVAF